MGQYWHIALGKKNANVRVDPSRYGAGLKFLEFAFSPKTLLVLHDMLRGNWVDCSVALVGDYCTSAKGAKTNAYATVSLLDLGLTEVDPDLSQHFKTNDDRAFERFGFTRLKYSVGIRADKLYVLNASKNKHVVIRREDYDSPQRVAALMWLLVDRSSMGHGSGDIKPEKNSVLDKTLGAWAYDRVQVLHENEFLAETPTRNAQESFDQLADELNVFC